MIQSFNLFRVNCLLNDTKASNFNSIILSIINEFLYEVNNEPQKLDDIFNYINDYLKIETEYDFLYGLIAKSEFYIIENTTNFPYVSVKPEKFHEIVVTINSNSIEKYIDSFLNETGKEFKFKHIIENLLYGAVFENINSFSVDNLKSLLPKADESEFTQEAIDIFNAFLDYDDIEKNKNIFNVLSRAVEFAILTSGKGIKEMNIDIFTNKIFTLDANIIFRLLGVGGDERRNSTLSLLQKCQKLGITFQYTGKTHLELLNKLNQIVNFLKSERVQSNIDILGDLSDLYPELFNDDFILHYSILRGKNLVKTPEQYHRKLHMDYQSLLLSLNAKVVPSETIDDRKISYLSKILFAKKKEMGIRYSNSAAVVDAVNILVVRKQRGDNIYNFSDIKSFYLTSDRSLNAIVAKESSSEIPETILPSQVYILCKPYFEVDHDNDYDEFIKFIKRRKTGFKYAGPQVLSYINSIRELTTDIEVIGKSLIFYSDIRYKTATSGIYDSQNTMSNYKTVLRTILDEQLNKGIEANNVFNSLKDDTKKFAVKKYNRAITIVRITDVTIIIFIVPIVALVVKIFTDKLFIIFLVVLICEGLKFYISSRSDFFNLFTREIYTIQTKSKRRSLASIHSELVKIIDDVGDLINKNIWNKRMV